MTQSTRDDCMNSSLCARQYCGHLLNILPKQKGGRTKCVTIVRTTQQVHTKITCRTFVEFLKTEFVGMLLVKAFRKTNICQKNIYILAYIELCRVGHYSSQFFRGYFCEPFLVFVCCIIGQVLLGTLAKRQ